MSEIHQSERAEGGVREASSGAVDQAREKASEATDIAREKAGQVASRAGEQVRTQVDERTTQIGGQVRQVAGALRQSSDGLRDEGQQTAARFTEQAARQVEQLGGYLERVDGDTLMRDIEDFARRRPWLVAGGGLLLGLAASRFLKASSERRYRSSQPTYRQPYPQTWADRPDGDPVPGRGIGTAMYEGRPS